MTGNAALLGAAPPIATSRRGPLRNPLLTVSPLQLAGFSLFVLAFVGLTAIYFVNIVQWSRGAELGFYVFFHLGQRELSGQTELALVFGEAEQAGLRKGDRIIAVNGAKVASQKEFDLHLNMSVPGQNSYTINRDGQIFAVTVPNKRLGFGKAFQRFGLTFVFGVIFFGIGVTVWVMKPGIETSWTFFTAMFNTSLLIGFSMTSKLWPPCLNGALVYGFTFVPASFLHLALIFPQERLTAGARKAIVLCCYLFSVILFFAVEGYSTAYADLAKHWQLVLDGYLALSFVVFLSFVLIAYLRSPDAVARARAQIILLGTAAMSVLPMANLLTMRFAGLTIIPTPVLNLPFFAFFPLAIAYSIVRHNLFDADVYVKRAVGYAIITVLVVTAYLTIQTTLDRLVLTPLLDQQAEQMYPLVFALLVVFLFNPVYRWVQTLVDEVFFRKGFDYKATVLATGNALASVLDLQEIIRRIINVVRQQMFIDTAGIVVMTRDRQGCQPFFLGDEGKDTVRDQSATVCLSRADHLISLIDQERKLITRYDIEEDARFQDFRDDYLERFESLGASIGFPLLYHDELVGVLFIGYKKSGKFYSREDIDLLQTLTTQGAVAIDNARLVEQMKQEEMVRVNLTRYLSPQIVEQVVQDKMELNLGGQRKTVTVLFSDIRNFTSISETWPPEQLVTILNEYFTEMVRTIFDHQGIIDKFVGDAIVAVFGSLIEVTNPAQNAAQAAMAMMHRMPELNRRWEDTFGVNVHMGIGISTGEVFLGNVGSPERMEFTVIGDTVNVASRFSGLAKADQILATRETIERLDPAVACRALPKVKVKGKAQDMDVFEIDYTADPGRQREFATPEVSSPVVAEG